MNNKNTCNFSGKILNKFLFFSIDSYQSNTTQNVLDTIISVQPKEAGIGGGESREDSVARQANEMLSKLPPAYDPFEVKNR